jgi:SAM-dependent methyltransferase
LETDWDKRYREGFYDGADEAHELVGKFSRLIPPGKPVIDIAMGNGRDLIFLAGKGFPVYGLEKSEEAIRLARQSAQKERRQLTAVRGDAHRLPFRAGAAGCVLVFYFLLREIMDELARLLAPGGILLYETFLKRQNELDGPRDPRYLLDDGELLGYFGRLDLLSYEEAVFDAGGKQRAVARYVGRKR